MFCTTHLDINILQFYVWLLNLQNLTLDKFQFIYNLTGDDNRMKGWLKIKSFKSYILLYNHTSYLENMMLEQLLI